MKKSYLLMAAGLMAMTATAAPRATVLNGTESMALDINNVPVPEKVEMQKKAAKVSSARDLLGFKFVNYKQWMFSNEDPYNGQATAVLKAGDTSNEILICGLLPILQDRPVTMTVDIDKQTATIREQNLGFSEAGNANVAIQFYKANLDTQKWEATTAAEGEIDENGNISFDLYAIMVMNADKEGYGWGGFGGFEFAAGTYYAPTPNWSKVGTASYQDGWLQPIVDGEISAVPVDVYINTADKEIGFKDPYANQMWDQMNTPRAGESKDGWVIIGYEYDECICVRPLVRSGFWLDMGNGAGIDEEIQELFMYNQEGMKYYRQDITPEEQADEYWAISEDPADYLSFYDKATRTFTLRNLYFGESDAPLAAYWWVSDPESTARTYITLDQDIFEGVENVMFDENAPVKYFNLQGLEVANPTKGQVVIKTQGNKAQKVVVK